MKRRTNQGGSVASFVIIGVILAVGLLTSIYFLNQRGQQARKEQTTTVADNKTNIPKPEATNTTTDKSTTNSTTKTTDDTTTESQNSKLPATGIETSISSLVSAFLLTTSAVAYITSRRQPEHSL